MPSATTDFLRAWDRHQVWQYRICCRTSCRAQQNARRYCASSTRESRRRIISSRSYDARPTNELAGAFGDVGVRTPDPLLAKQVLYQLSYIPARRGPRSSRRPCLLFFTRSRILRREYGRVAAAAVNGGIAQLVEHYAGSVRVRSSSLLASTIERPFLSHRRRCALRHTSQELALASPESSIGRLYPRLVGIGDK